MAEGEREVIGLTTTNDAAASMVLLTTSTGSIVSQPAPIETASAQAVPPSVATKTSRPAPHRGQPEGGGKPARVRN
jgi:hypothetical protein